MSLKTAASAAWGIGPALVAVMLHASLFSLLTAAPVLQSPSKAAVDAAIATPFIRYNRNLPGGAHTNGAWNGGASVALAVASYAGNTSSDARLLEQIRYTLIGSNGISASGGYSAQHERHMTTAFVFAKLTPRIWDQLTAVEKTKIDLLMKASLVSSAFTTSDNNPYVKASTQQYALDADPNLNRDWNPNYREGMIGGVLVGMAYFGGVAATDAILDTYNHAQFVSALAANGLSNTYETFNWKAANPGSLAPAGTVIEAAVKSYRYYGVALANYMQIYNLLVTDTFGKNVNCGLNNGAGLNGAGKIVAGCDTLPNKGALGMLKEFDSIDALGPRSSAVYSYDGYRPHRSTQLALIAAGLWQAQSSIALNAVARINVGHKDFWDKVEKGYSDYQKGGAAGIFDLSQSVTWGFVYNRALWEDVLMPYHGLSSVPPPTYVVGARVQTSKTVNVRASGTLTGTLLGTQASGVAGTIVAGPVLADGFTWWQINYDSGVDGWSGEDNLTSSSAAVPPSAPTGLKVVQ